MKKSVLLLSALALVIAPLRAATFTVPIEVSDRVVLADGSLRFVSDTVARVGLGYSTIHPGDLILPFALPSIPAGEYVSSATLTVNLESAYNAYNHLRNVDLWGVKNTLGSSTVLSGHYIDGTAAPGAVTSAIRLQDNYITPADIASAPGQFESQDFGRYVHRLYAGGATAGQYGFLNLAHDTELPLLRYYVFTSANGANAAKRPYLIIETKPGFYLDTENGSDANLGSISAPWKTFAHAQTQLEPGDTLFCTGNFGLVEMKSTGSTPYAKGTDGNPISYKRWPGKCQPTITRLVFDKVRQDTYLDFEGFRFDPGEVDTANYTENTAIYLEGAWHIRFNDCDVEGAKLRIDSPNVSSDPAVSFRPYHPMSPHSNPAITAGANASHVIVENCRIKNCGIGIMVTEVTSTTKFARNWQILNNDISNVSEDGIRFAGASAGADSIVRGNVIHDQNTYQSALWWYGFSYRGETRDKEAFTGRQWARVKQRNTDSTGVLYFISYRDASDESIGYQRFNILADNRTTYPLRNTSDPWELIDDPTTPQDESLEDIEFRPSNRDGVPVNGDSCHTDCFAVMSRMTNGIIEGNRFEISEWVGGAIKMEHIPLRNSTTQAIIELRVPENITVSNNLMYSRQERKAGIPNSTLVIVAGGKNTRWVNNTILGGPAFQLGNGIRFIDTVEDDGVGFENVQFYNNIISGGGARSDDGPTLATSSHNYWMQPPPTTPALRRGIALGDGDEYLPAGLTKEEALAIIKFEDYPAGDLRLSSTSPARNIGRTDLPIPTVDINDYERDANPDAGSFEYGSPLPTPKPTPDPWLVGPATCPEES